MNSNEQLSHMKRSKFVVPDLKVTKRKKVQTKQLINGEYFHRDRYFSIKIYKNFGKWKVL